MGTAQGKVERLCDANAVLAEQVMEAEHDHDAAAVESSTTMVRVGQYQDRQATLLEAYGDVIDVLSPVG